jgi:D-alanine transaminase
MKVHLPANLQEIFGIKNRIFFSILLRIFAKPCILMGNQQAELVWLNGIMVPKQKAFITPDDRGFLFADGVYEVVRWYGSFFLGMDGHQKRLSRSLSEMRIDGFEMNEFPSVCQQLLEVNQLQDEEALVYLEITRGASPRTHHFPVQRVPPTVYGFARRFLPDKQAGETGVAVALLPDIRWMRCDIKSVSLLGNVLSYQQAKEKGLYECIFHRDGIITEASHSNILFVRDGEVCTHPESPLILSGITRGIVLQLAKAAGIRISLKPVTVNDLFTCDEAFLASTSAEVMPVVEIDGRKIGNGTPGRITRQLQEAFKQYILRKGN